MKNILKILSHKVVSSLENFFEAHGRFVARYPLIVIAVSIVCTGLMSVGVLRYREENNAFKLWIPDDSDFVSNNEWLEKNAPMNIRFNSLLVTIPDGNILQPAVLQYIQDLVKKIESEKTSSGLSWPDVCFNRTVASMSGGNIPDQSTIDEMYENGTWCPLLQSMLSMRCFDQSILQLWEANHDFSKDTVDSVLEVINKKPLMNQVFGTPVNIGDYLGKIKRDANQDNKIVGAEAASLQWYGWVNMTKVTPDDISNTGTGDIVDANSLEWELMLLNLLQDAQDNQPSSLPNLETFINVGRSYSDIAGETIMNDAIMMPIGFMIVFVYVFVMLGKFTCTENRVLLALGGIACIGLTVGFMYGFCSAVNLFYGPMHNVIPFLLLGIGIDDMFVIMQCYDNLGPERTSDIATNIGLTMRHAGVAITVTSFTDFIVFALGATTVLPALRSFCLWCSVGIIMVYVFQSTLFAAFLALDCRRLASSRNGICPCFRHRKGSFDTEKVPDDTLALSLSQKIFKAITKVILSWPGMICVLLAAGGILGGGIYGLTQLQQKFDPVWFLPQSSYLYKWFLASDEYFPGDGEVVTVYITEMDWTKELDNIGLLGQNLAKEKDMISRVDSWHESFINFNNTQQLYDLNSEFLSLLTYFLFTPPTGFAYQPNFKFPMDSNGLQCGVPAPNPLLSTISFQHINFNGDRDSQIDALNRVTDILEDIPWKSGKVFAITREYSNWETDAVITEELFRNLGLAMACVFVTTLILLADFLGSVYVLLCVAMTLVDLCGYMHFWGLTVDVVSSVNIIIAIGLCVDYSAHICHTFLTLEGSRRDRAAATLINIGPAVLNGGISTFIAFILLAGSESHVFSSFFKIFFLVCVLGLFHGLIVLPVILSMLGPSSYTGASPASLYLGSNQVEEIKKDKL